MKNSIKFLSICFLALGLISWTLNIPNPSIKYASGDTIDSVILLELNEDGTFSYQDLSHSEKPVKIEGTYSQNSNKVKLESKSSQKFHNHWNISEDGKKAKSRKGLTFYSLVRLD